MATSSLSLRKFSRMTAGMGALAIGPELMRSAPAGDAPLMAYVGTYSSPPLPPPPGKVDLPPGNGRGIHVFRVDRATGALTPAGVFEHGTSPSGLVVNSAGTRMYSTNATDRF